MMEIIDVAQGTPEWFKARLGIPTASMFGTVRAKGRGGDESKTRRKYLLQLAGEIITQQPMESYSNDHMERGKEQETEARNLYSYRQDVEPVTVGFVRKGNCGASPDALVGDDGALELKSKLPHILLEHLLSADFPPEHKAQCQGVLYVTEREWIDLGAYWPKLPLVVKRAYRDEPYIRELEQKINEFNDELAEIVERIRSYGG